MNQHNKGKACIIEVSTFDKLPRLDGYKNDTRNLSALFSQIGFEVVFPCSNTDKCLTSHVCIHIIF